jgi:catechol 2,3-dioxygenase-like lactoylglutathione lyase family enzyme
MTLPGLTLINLFVEDLDAARAFYRDVLALDLAFEDENASAYKLGAVLVNLLTVSAAREQIAPAKVADPDAGVRVQLAITVDDIDAECAALAAKGVTLVNGPENQPWGMRTSCFADPAGHLWELAQPIAGA